MEKREGTLSEDIAYVSNAIINDDRVMNALEQFIMYNSKPIVYQTSLITAQTLLLTFNSNDKAKFASMQPKLVESTMLLLWHIQLLFSSSSIRQKNLSASVAALTLFRNIDHCSLIARIFPRSLLRKVDAEKWYTDWEPANWKEFFALLQNNYNATTEQWNEECRRELVTKIRNTVIEFLQEKYKNGAIKWNYEEFQVLYSCLEQKCFVGNYYLIELILFDEFNSPYLKEPVINPQGFWNKLVIGFFEETQNQKKLIILTAMVLIYKEYSEIIGQCDMLPHYIYLLDKVEERHLHLSIVKLILATVKAKGPVAFKENYRIILKANGIKTLLNMICKLYGTKDDREEKIQICCCIIKIIGCILKRKEKSYYLY